MTRSLRVRRTTLNVVDFFRQNIADPYPSIPGDLQLPFLGDTLNFLRDPIQLLDNLHQRHGKIFKVRMIGENLIAIADAAVSHEILADKDGIYSSRKGWDFAIGGLFKDGLLLRDGQEHRYHRQMLQQSFLKEPMAGYLQIMQPIAKNYIAHNFAADDRAPVFPKIKQLTLLMATAVFFGIKVGDSLPSINRAISDIVHAVTGLLRVPVPFTTYGKGFVARAELMTYFRSLIQDRRRNPTPDLFGQLCIAEIEGKGLTDDEIMNHAIFILMAAHDTTASSVTSLMYELSKQTDWQHTLREESIEFYRAGDLDYGRLKELEKLGWAFKATLRLHPPLVVFPRKLEKAVELAGYHLPEGSRVAVVAHLLHRSRDYWQNANSFDPARFAPGREEHKIHPGAFVPFGSGKHLCLGLTFAEMQVKLIMSTILTKFKWQSPHDYAVRFSVPIQEPMDGLPLKLHAI